MIPVEKEVTTPKDDRLRCAECGRRLDENDKVCPNCGSKEKTNGHIDFRKTSQTKITVSTKVGGTHEAHMNPQSWTLLGVILAFIIPPIFYAVFSILEINFWYKFLIWLGVIIIPFSFAYKYRIIWYKIIMLLRSLAAITYGKHKI